ncbi:MAG: hypothetical protein V4531_14255 [Actinomycetota bacterium]
MSTSFAEGDDRVDRCDDPERHEEELGSLARSHRETGRIDELSTARRRGEEYLLRRRLRYSRFRGEILGPRMTRLAYRLRSFYSALNAVDYFRSASLFDGAAPDPRLADAIESVRNARQQDGAWLQQRRHPGRVW